MIHAEDFMRDEERKVQQSLVELVKELYRDEDVKLRIKKGPLNGIGYPTMVKSDSTVVADFSKEVFMAGKRGVKKLVHTESGWIEDTSCLESYGIESRNYTGISLLDIDRIPYVALGYNRGIHLYNLNEMEAKKIVFPTVEMTDFKAKSGFKNISVVASSQGDYLWATHSAMGILRVPLDDFCTYDSIKADLSRDYFILQREMATEMPVRLAVADNGVYMSVGKDVYFTADAAMGKEPEKVFLLPGDVTVLKQGKNSIVYCGTSDGKIYKNDVLYANVKNISSELRQIAEGTFNKKEGVFFTTCTGKSFSPVFFTDGSQFFSVPSRRGVIDFQISYTFGNRSVYCLTEDSFFSFQLEGKEIKRNEELKHSSHFYANALCIRGGKI